MKRTIENCGVIKRNSRDGYGAPSTEDWGNGEIRCAGYGKGDNDEPINKCMDCPLNTAYDDEATFALREGMGC